MTWTKTPVWITAVALALLSSSACSDADGEDQADGETGDGDGDVSGDGDGDVSGDGDGDGDVSGDGDGDATGDGDGDSGDGDGDGDATGDGDGDATGDGDGDTSGDGDGDATGDGDGDGEAIMCPGVFPMFDKTCGDVSECVVAVHTTDCCGNSVALGINEADQAEFAAAEAICDSQYPPDCGCPAGPTTAEDGDPIMNPMDLQLDCVAGSCTTFVP